MSAEFEIGLGPVELQNFFSRVLAVSAGSTALYHTLPYIALSQVECGRVALYRTLPGRESLLSTTLYRVESRVFTPQPFRL